MPKVKGKSKYVKRYDEELIQNALLEIENGMPKKQAAVRFGIPRQTLQYRLSDKFKKIRHGPSSYLTGKEESTLEQWIIDSNRKGFPRRKNDILASVKYFLDKNPRQTPFKDNTPGRHWYNAFRDRHPGLVSRIPEAVTKASSAVSENDIRNWFSNIEKYLKEKQFFDILNDPTRVYNGDETCFLLCPKEEKVIAPRGSRNVYQVDQGLAKANLTVMFTFAASGAVTPPMIIYPYKRLPNYIVSSVPGDWGVGISDNGWMKSELFFEYISNIFHPHLVNENIEFPIILFVDGHKTHMTYELSVLCSKLEIILIALYPNSTRILQPADVACFKPLKNAWKLAVLKWRRHNPLVQLNKVHFAPILKEALQNLKASSISNGFRACGLFPWNVASIDFTKCLGKSTKVKVPIDDKTDECSSMTYYDFMEIIGHEKLEKIKTKVQTQSVSNSNEDFELLVKIFLKLAKHGYDDTNEEVNDSVVRIDDVDLTESEELLDQVLLTEEQIDNMSFIFSNNDTTINEVTECTISTSSAYKSQPSTSSGFRNDNVEIIFSCDNSQQNLELTLPDTSFSSKLTVPGTPENKTLDTDISKKKCDIEPADSSSKSIGEYLLWHNTPERKGNRQSERIPFVITSSGWKKIQEDKQNEKLEKEKQKEENKKRRELSAAAKAIKGKAIKKAPHIKNLTSVMKNIGNISRAQAEDEQNLTIGEILKTSNKNEDKAEHINLPSPVNIMGETNTTAGEENATLFEQTSGMSIDGNCNSSPPKNNKIVNKGLCFICVKNASIANFAVKCEKCTRIFHYRCLKKHNLYVEHFLCKKCLKK